MQYIAILLLLDLPPQPHPNMYLLQADEVTDAHAIESGRPVTDECTQDWTLVSSEVDADSLVFEAERALSTGDTQDHLFIDDSADGEFVFLWQKKGTINGAKKAADTSTMRRESLSSWSVRYACGISHSLSLALLSPPRVCRIVACCLRG